MTPSQNQDSPHDHILKTVFTLLRAVKMDHRPDFRSAGADIEAHLLKLTPLRRSSPPASSRLAESDAQDP
jgi:hypothetical protein